MTTSFQPPQKQTKLILPDGQATPFFWRWLVDLVKILAFQVNPQTANTVYAGPTSGPVALPAFRALVTADMPGLAGTVNITTAKLTPGGANGSMTFVNGILTAQTPAT